MSDSVGQIDLDLGLNYGAFNNQLDGIAGKASGMVGGAFAKLGGIIAGAFAVGALVNFGREAINLASDLQEVQNVVDVTFGNMAAEVDNWSKNMIESFGLSELSAKKYASTMGAMLKSSGLAGSTMKDMSKNLTELAADMASFYNLSNDEAFYKVFAGMTGETEPLKALGVNMSVANMEAFALSQGISKSWMAMSQAEQTMLRYNYLLQVTADAQGDFARTSDSWANQVKILGEQWKIFQGTMGAGFINILTPVVKWLNFLVRKIQIAAEYFKAFTELIFGNASDISNTTSSAAAATDDAAGAMEDMGKATDGAGKKVKKANKAIKGSLGGFDQLNTLTQSTAKALGDAADSAGAAAGIGAVDLGSMATGEIDLGLDTAKLDNFKSSLLDIQRAAGSTWKALKMTFGPSIKIALDAIRPVMDAWKDSLIDTVNDFKTLGEPIKNWVLNDIVPLWQKGIEIGGELQAGYLDSLLKVFDSIRNAAFPIIEWFVVEGLPILTEFVGGALEIFQSLFNLTKQIFDDLWMGVIDPVLKLISNIIIDALNIIKEFWDDWGVKIVEGLKTALDSIKKLWETLWNGFLKPFMTKILDTLTWLWDKHLKGLIKEITTFVGKLVTAALDILNKFIMPIVNYLVEKLGPTFSDVFSFVVDVIGTAVGAIADVVKGIIKALGGVVDFIAGVFTGDWKRAWNGIKTFTQGIGDAIVGVFKGAVNLIIDAFNFMIRSLNKVNIDIPDWVPGIGGESLGFTIPQIPKLAKGGLAYGPTLAMVGDNKGAKVDPEVVSPLSKLQDMIGANNQPMIDVLLMILDALRSNDKTTVLQIGETEFGRLAIQSINNAQRRAGKTLLNI